MQSIKSVQALFQQAIFNKNNENLDFIKSPYSKERINIYRQTIYENMRSALAITFPGIWTLIGEECANSVAYNFYIQLENLPSSGCIDYWGDKFSSFLKEQKELENLTYLEDYANYEWLKHLSYGAKESQAIKIEEIATFSQEEIEVAKFLFIPSTYLFNSKIQIHKIEEIVNNPNAKEINLNDEPSYAIISRIQNSVLTHWIGEDLYHFIQFLMQGTNLSESSEKTEKLYQDFNLTNALAFMLQKQIIAKVIA